MSRRPAHSRRHSRAYNNPSYEDRIKATWEKLDDGTYTSTREASRKENKVYIKSMQALKRAEESVLVDDIVQAGESATPMDHQALRAHTSEIAERQLGKNWSRRFWKWHPQLVVSKPLPPGWISGYFFIHLSLDSAAFGHMGWMVYQEEKWPPIVVIDKNPLHGPGSNHCLASTSIPLIRV